MFSLFNIIALSTVFFAGLAFSQPPVPVHRCYTPKAQSLEIGQCELAVLQFKHKPQGGVIRTGNHMETKTCGNCQVTLATLDGKADVTISLLSSLDAVRDTFNVCRGYGTVVVDAGEHQSSTNLTLSLGNAARCREY
ncbi:secreted protein [Melampsora americana]|nr:secreted protein [Melampsora americana]KAH9810301.1 secreted protein [Melampsora americana]